MEEPQLNFIDTSDGWQLAVYRYPAPAHSRKKYPVLLIHGLSTNRYDVDFPNARLSMAKYLRSQGFDTWMVELRGTGLSRRRGWYQRIRARCLSDWTFDDYIFKDLPTVARYLRKKTGRKKIHWIGHSLGGTVLYAALGTMPQTGAASAVVLGAGMSASARPGFVRLGLKADPILKWFPFLPLVAMARLGRPLAHWLAGLQENVYYARENLDKKTLQQAMKIAVEDVSVPLFMQLHDWYKNNHFCSLDKKISYRDNLKKIRTPFLVGAGSVDGVIPYPDVHFGFRMLGARSKKMVVFGKEQGCKTEYGHIDLVLGKNAPDEVYPVVADWLTRHDR